MTELTSLNYAMVGVLSDWKKEFILFPKQGGERFFRVKQRSCGVAQICEASYFGHVSAHKSEVEPLSVCFSFVAQDMRSEKLRSI